jgi:hypothetical protein
VFFRHVLDDGRDVRDLAGVTSQAFFNEETQSVDGVVFLYRNAAGRELGTLAQDFRRHRQEGIPRPNVGVSIDAFFQLEKAGNGAPRTVRMSELLSVDVVFQPAADGRILAGGQDSVFSCQCSVFSGQCSGGSGPCLDGGFLMEQERVEVEDVVVEEEERVGAEMAGTAEEWLSSVRQEAVNARLARAGLPAAVTRRLAAGQYGSPAALDEAIQAARDELAELAEAEIISIGGEAPRARVSGMQTGVERIAGAVDWLFGVRDAALPEPLLRDVRHLYHAITGDFEFYGRFQPERVQMTGATTTTLADLAANAMNKVIVQQFSVLSHWRWYERVTAATPNDGSVQDMQWTVLGGVANLDEVPEKGAYGEISMGDVAESNSFAKYGGYVPVTLEMIRNSDIQRMQAVPRALALAAVRTRSAKVAEIFTANSGVGPTLEQDSTALFDASHGNLQTTAFGTDATAWRAARAECFNQAEVNSGKKLGLFPRYWLGPADLYDQALETFGYGEGMPTTFAPEAQDRGFADPRPIPLAVPDFTDADDWAYIVDPLVFPVIHISYAQAPGGGVHPAPELFTVSSPTAGLMFSNDVLPIKVRDWFAIGVNGYRGIGKRNVS